MISSWRPEGAGFLAVHAASNVKKHQAWKLIDPPNPIVARHYSLDGRRALQGRNVNAGVPPER